MYTYVGYTYLYCAARASPAPNTAPARKQPPTREAVAVSMIRKQHARCVQRLCLQPSTLKRLKTETAWWRNTPTSCPQVSGRLKTNWNGNQTSSLTPYGIGYHAATTTSTQASTQTKIHPHRQDIKTTRQDNTKETKTRTTLHTDGQNTTNNTHHTQNRRTK